MKNKDRSTDHRIGILGGTFDPVHIGHLILGEETRIELGLEKVLFIPSHNPPHKRNRIGRASDAQRVEMLRLAISDNPGFALSMVEMERPGLSYTYQTLELLNQKSPGTEYVLILGADCLFDFDTWMKPERIAAACSIAVGYRDRYDSNVLMRRVEELKNRYGARICLVDSHLVDISSSMLREYCARGRRLTYYVPSQVQMLIEKEGLYKEAGS